MQNDTYNIQDLRKHTPTLGMNVYLWIRQRIIDTIENRDWRLNMQLKSLRSYKAKLQSQLDIINKELEVKEKIYNRTTL